MKNEALFPGSRPAQGLSGRPQPLQVAAMVAMGCILLAGILWLVASNLPSALDWLEGLALTMKEGWVELTRGGGSLFATGP